VKYALDTNLYIRAIRERLFAAELADFFARHSPRTFLSSIVYHEIVIGAGSPARLREIEIELGRPFLKAGRVFTTSHRAWVQGAEALAKLAFDYGMDRSKLPRSFVNDVLIAASCAEAGVTLVTDNVRDFARIGAVMRFEFTAPWPGSSGTDEA
jgi:predicted nucleic acid-binding protein